MSRRSLLVVGTLLGVVLSFVAVQFCLYRYQPRWYLACSMPPGQLRLKRSAEFMTEFSELINGLGGEREWYARFTDEQINSFFCESFMQSRLQEELHPDGISEPRVKFEPDRMRIAFRAYANRFYSTVVSMTLRMWVVRSEPNVIAIQIESCRAGLWPSSIPQWILEQVTTVARQHGIEVSWYRHEGHPVALVRFQIDKPKPTLQFKALQLEEGVLTIHGRSNEPPRVAAGQ